MSDGKGCRYLKSRYAGDGEQMEWVKLSQNRGVEPKEDDDGGGAGVADGEMPVG